MNGSSHCDRGHTVNPLDQNTRQGDTDLLGHAQIRGDIDF